MRYHIQELRRNRTVEDKVAIEELHLLDSLVPLQGRDGGMRLHGGYSRPIVVLVLGSTMWIWAVRFLRLENRAVVIIRLIVAGLVIGWEIRKGVLFMN
jgi:hypothetical protein